MDPLTSQSLAMYGGGLGAGLQNAMSQMWQVNQGNQQAAAYDAMLRQQMEALNAQLNAAKNMQHAQLAQSQQNNAIGALSKLYGIKQMGNVFGNMMGGLGGMFGNMFGGAGGGMGGPMSMRSNSGAGFSFGGGGAGGQGGSGQSPIDYSNPNNIAKGYQPSQADAYSRRPGQAFLAMRSAPAMDPSSVLMRALTSGGF